ncbi:uncharacterized protein TNCV_2228771 [Trichonephila clavipes]|nr:uncharacterized protein TNCV_2228771 [Trichonephila clavipes]
MIGLFGKTAFASRFKRLVAMHEFLAHQSERKRKYSETLVDYIYAKVALPEKAPLAIPQDRISIIGDVTEEKWQIALATQNSDTGEEVDRTKSLDAIRNSRRNSNRNRNSTPGRYATTNPSNSVNCIQTQTEKRALIPVINDSIEIKALCDPCADIPINQQSCIPADGVIQPWTYRQFQVVDHKTNQIGCISLNLSVGNIVHNT